MESATHRSTQTREGATAGPAFVSLDCETHTADVSRTLPTLAELIAAEKKDRTPLQQRELAGMQQQGAPPTYPPLAHENRATVETACAAYHLNRQPQTLRGWACLENGPLRPVRLHGRLAWKTEDLRRLLGVA